MMLLTQRGPNSGQPYSLYHAGCFKQGFSKHSQAFFFCVPDSSEQNQTRNRLLVKTNNTASKLPLSFLSLTEYLFSCKKFNNKIHFYLYIYTIYTHFDKSKMLSVHLCFKNKWQLLQLVDQETSQLSHGSLYKVNFSIRPLTI